MKGMRPNFGWIKNTALEGNAHFAASPNGWTDNELGVDWIRDCFVPHAVNPCVIFTLSHLTLTLAHAEILMSGSYSSSTTTSHTPPPNS